MVLKKNDEKRIANVIKQFYLEISIFEFSNNVKINDQQPYYQISKINFYQEFHDQIHSTTKKFLNIICPRTLDAKILVPLFLASRSLSFTINSQFIIVVDSSTKSISIIKESYEKILAQIDSKKKFKCISITSSLANFIEKSKNSDETDVIIALLTPMKALRLIHKKWPNFHHDVTFLKKTTFIINDINERGIETDVLSQDIFENIFKLSLIDEVAKFVTIGTSSDERYLNVFGSQCDTFSIPIKVDGFQIKKVVCKSAYEIEKMALICELKKFFDNWVDDDKIEIGSVIIFVPNAKTGRSLYKHIFKIYNENSKNVVLVRTKIKKDELIKSLQKRLLDEIEKETDDKEDDKEKPHDETETESDDKEDDKKKPHDETETKSDDKEDDKEKPHDETETKSDDKEDDKEKPHDETEKETDDIKVYKKNFLIKTANKPYDKKSLLSEIVENSCIIDIFKEKLRNEARGFNYTKDYKKILIDDSTKEGQPDEIVNKSDNKKNDRGKLLFILPFNLTGSITDEEEAFINASLPSEFQNYNFVRVIITTNENENFIRNPDTTVIFDSGLTEVEYYDTKKCVSKYNLELLPKDIIEQRKALFENNIDNKRKIHFIFSLEIQNYIAIQEAISNARRYNFTREILLLRNFRIKLEELKILQANPLLEFIQDGLKILKNIGLIDLETDQLTNKGKTFIESSFPPQFNENNFDQVGIISPPNTICFDFKLNEYEYNNAKKCASKYKLKQIFIDKKDDDGAFHFIFYLENQNRIEIKNAVSKLRRCNLMREILSLRSIGIKLEEQKNLPTEPLYEIVQDGLKTLKSIGLIDLETGKLTDEGKAISSFCVSPQLALATFKFDINQKFAFLVSLLIENSVDLIENSQSELLCENFCGDSDVVTLLNSILSLNATKDDQIIDENEIKYENSGLSINSLESIYLTMKNTFDNDESSGREMAINSIIWAKNKEGGIIKMVDEYVDLLDEDNFLNLRKASFECVCGVGNGKDPKIVYKANDLLKFDEIEDASFLFSNRPGWNGFQTPGNIIALSFKIEEQNKTNVGLLLHRDPSTKGKNPGVISQEVKESLNSCFFVALFEAYCDQKTINDMIPIYHSYKPNKKETGFLIHINQNNNKTYINYCPKNEDAKNSLSQKILILSSLIPFVPRSVLALKEDPSCVVEITSYGTGANLKNFVYLLDKDDSPKPKPNAYPINKNILDYANDNVSELMKIHPKIRFAITGESILYKFVEETQIETDFCYPNVDPKITSVFDPMHSSHLVLLVDQDYSPQPTFEIISWILNKKNDIDTKSSIDIDDELSLFENVSNKIMTDLGVVKKSFDLFYVTIDGGLPCVEKGEIPTSIEKQVGFEEGVIHQGVHKLIQQFEKNFIQIDDNSKSSITLQSISSTDIESKKFIDDESKVEFCELINNEIKDKYSDYSDLYVGSLFLGPSMILILIKNLPNKETQHPQPKNIWDDSYQSCNADKKIKDVFRNNLIRVSSITHEPSFEIIIDNIQQYAISENRLNEEVLQIVKQFGFFNYIDLYTRYDDSYVIHLIGEKSCFACVNCISKKLPALKKIDSMYYSLNPMFEYSPEIELYNKLIHIPQYEIDAMKDLITSNKYSKLNENYRVLLMHSNAQKNIDLLPQQEENVKCFCNCEKNEPELISHCLYANSEDGKIITIRICRKCVISLISNLESIRLLYDNKFHLLKHKEIKDTSKRINGLGIIKGIKDFNSDFWPQIPIGQIIWALMSDTSSELKCFVKAWFTIAVESSI